MLLLEGAEEVDFPTEFVNPHALDLQGLSQLCVW